MISKLILACIVVSIIIHATAYASTQPSHIITNKGDKPKNWGIALYKGEYSKRIFLQNIIFHYHPLLGIKTEGLTLSYDFPDYKKRSVIFNYFNLAPELGLNVALIDDIHHRSIVEIDPYFAIRGGKFPWDRYLRTRIAMGIGLSYVSTIPSYEIAQAQVPRQLRHLLTYLIFEITVALPQYPVEVFFRVNHRSTLFRLLAQEGHANAVNIGLRYYF